MRRTTCLDIADIQRKTGHTPTVRSMPNKPRSRKDVPPLFRTLHCDSVSGKIRWLGWESNENASSVRIAADNKKGAPTGPREPDARTIVLYTSSQAVSGQNKSPGDVLYRGPMMFAFSLHDLPLSLRIFQSLYRFPLRIINVCHFQQTHNPECPGNRWRHATKCHFASQPLHLVEYLD